MGSSFSNEVSRNINAKTIAALPRVPVRVTMFGAIVTGSNSTNQSQKGFNILSKKEYSPETYLYYVSCTRPAGFMNFVIPPGLFYFCCYFSLFYFVIFYFAFIY